RVRPPHGRVPRGSVRMETPTAAQARGGEGTGSPQGGQVRRSRGCRHRASHRERGRRDRAGQRARRPCHGRGRGARGGAASGGGCVLTWPSSIRVYVATEPMDVRKSFDGLSAAAQHVLEKDPMSGHLFVFFNRRGNQVRCLFWDRTGIAPGTPSGVILNPPQEAVCGLPTTSW